ncbi:MAG: putative membrane protein [Candidatus Krumholzibacteriia bacterium]|jgi:uncharacterized membrane protein
MLKFLQRHFLTGLLAMTPLVITSWILWRFYNIINNNMRPLLAKLPTLNSAYPEFFLTIMGVLVFVILITFVGLFTRNVIGVAFFRVLERFFKQIPFVKSLFSLVQQIATVLLQDQRTAFQKVVLIAYPRPGIYSLGFVTRDEPGDELVTVFLPTSPNPTSGYMLLLPRDEVRALNIATEEAVKLIVSGGAVMTSDQLKMINDEQVILANLVGGES